MKCAITGHTRGIGLAIYNHFSQNNTVIGFSRSNGYDISKEISRQQIKDISKDCDVFINNAYNDYDQSQLDMLKLMVNEWANTDKIIINISTRFVDGDNIYSKTKKELDKFCEEFLYNDLHLVNLKPGLVDTNRVANIAGNKLSTEDIITVLNFIIQVKDKIKIKNITFAY